MDILIADGGSTKVDWRLLREGKEIAKAVTQGINPYVHSVEEISDVFKALPNNIFSNASELTVYFYAAGCSNPLNLSKMNKSFEKGFPKVKSIFIGHDLLAAARALFLDQDGIACILGTGSSLGKYVNDEILPGVLSLGYVLGDEGGGLYMGKQLLIGVMKGTAPKSISSRFFENFKYSKQDILDNIYHKPHPNRFIASFTHFLNENIHETYCREIVYDAFKTFTRLNLDQLENAKDFPIGFVGSVAFAFESILREVMTETRYQMAKVLKSPMRGLIDYHTVNE